MLNNAKKLVQKARDVIAPREDLGAAVAELETEVNRLADHKAAMEREHQIQSAAAYALPGDVSFAQERDAAAARLSDAIADLDSASAALAGMRLREADGQTAEAQKVRTARRERATEIYHQIHTATASMDAAVDTLARCAEKVQTLREELAGVTSAEVAALVRTGTFHTLASHRLSALGFDRCLAFTATDKPALAATLPALDYVLKVAKLN